MNDIENKSKSISKTDDSAAQLLMDVLGEDGGRNFDIESIFAERKNDGQWKWTIYEFLKADTIPPQASHPNYYWFKNKRKFLSLWTIVNVFRKAGFECDLLLVNYSDDKTLSIKEMIVKSIETDPSDIYREAYTDKDGIYKNTIKNHVKTIDKIMTYEEWKTKFRDFNKHKKGDTWDILDELNITIPLPLENSQSNKIICEYDGCNNILSENVHNYSIKNFDNKAYCFNCQQIIKDGKAL